MTKSDRIRLLAGTALLLVPAVAGAQAPTANSNATPSAQQGTAPAAPDVLDDYGDDNSVVVTGTRSNVIGDIPPEDTLDSRDVLATGATDINELLDALAPQLGSTQGRGGERPVMLLNGERISGFRELRDIPTEAIERVEILPEEVALKYGYSADQKVVNIVLRPRFRSTAALAEGKAATDGGYTAETGDVTRLMIQSNGRTSINLHAEGNGMLTEAQRNIALEQDPLTSDVTDDRAARSLIGSKLDLRSSGTVNRKVGTVGATLNGEVEHSEGRSLFGLSDETLAALARHNSEDTAHAGLALNWGSKWRWSSTANADLVHDVTRSDRATDLLTDRAISTRESADADLTANGDLFSLPAGSADTTARVAVSTLHQKSSRDGPDGDSSHSLGRTAGTASVNLDIPISHRNSDFGTLGNLTLNANAQVQQLSDFGTLTKIGGGTNWSPVDRLNLIASWTREQGAPTVQQLGDPLLSTPGSRIFDFVTGQTVLATVTTGGNPDLRSDRRTVVKLGGDWQPVEKLDLRLHAQYVHQKIDDPIATFPAATAAIEAAFPERFVRDSNGQLVSVDLRPVNFHSSRNDTLRIGFDFTHSLKSAPPSAAAMAAFRQRSGFGGPGGSSGGPGTTPPAGGAQAGASPSAGASAPPPPPESSGPPPGGSQQANAGPPPGPGGGPPGGFRGGGRFFGGGRNGGRVTFSLNDTITFVDKVAIRPGLNLDYLHGDAQGQSGGQPRHDVEARAAYFNNGLGAFLTADWRSGTEVNTATGDSLHFSPYATFDLRMFANLGQKYELVAKHPWLRGTSVRLEVDNIFNARPNVRDAEGAVPFTYQPDLLEPLGRTVMISFRKLFLPSPSWFRQQYQQLNRGGSSRS